MPSASLPITVSFGTFLIILLDTAGKEANTYTAAHREAFEAVDLRDSGQLAIQFGHNDSADAFRHGYVAARMSQFLGAELVTLLGYGNELKTELQGGLEGNPPSERNMDLFNNSVGASLAPLTITTPKEELLERLFEAVDHGELIRTTDPSKDSRVAVLPAIYQYAKPSLNELGEKIKKGFAYLREATGDAQLTKLEYNVLGNLLSLSHAISGAMAGLETAMERALIAAPIRGRGWDPLSLDLNGDGQVRTLPVTAGTHFDHDANGFSEATGWIVPEDGLVVRDLNGNGTIDSGRELFGDQTRMPDGSLAKDGFTAFAALDTNGDGRVDNQDAGWASLRTWQDSNSDGVSTPNELHTLDSRGITAINLAASSVSELDPQNNTRIQSGTFVRADGSTGIASSFVFDVKPISTTPKDTLPVSADISALPDLNGFGNVYDLSQAMARDSTLQAMVQSYAANTDPLTLSASFDAILKRWTGADAVADGSRGASVDAQHLAVLESFSGSAFRGVGQSANPNGPAGAILELAYAQLSETLRSQLLVQVQLKPYSDAITFSWDSATNSYTPNFEIAANLLQSDLGSRGTAEVSILWQFVTALKGMGLTNGPAFTEFVQSFANSGQGYDRVISAALNGNPLAIGGMGSDTLTATRSSGRVVFGLDGDDNITGTQRYYNSDGPLDGDRLYGGDGNDNIQGYGGRDYLYGGAGDDHIAVGGFGSPTLADGTSDVWGGTGDDVIEGGVSTTYHFDKGDGNDTIIPYFEDGTIQFGASVAPSEVSVSRDNLDLILKVGDSDSIRVAMGYSKYYGLKGVSVSFADGTSWTKATVIAMGLAINGTDGADSLYGLSDLPSTIHGGAGNDYIASNSAADQLYGDAGDDKIETWNGQNTLLDGGAGNDFLRSYSWSTGPTTYRGGAGDDTIQDAGADSIYLFALGDGHDVITDNGGVDTLKFEASVQPTDISVQKDGFDLVLLVGTSDSIRLSNWFYGAGASCIETVQFDDGTSLSMDDLSARVLQVQGSSGTDTLSATPDYSSTLIGGTGTETFVTRGREVVELGSGTSVVQRQVTTVNTAAVGVRPNDSIFVTSSIGIATITELANSFELHLVANSEGTSPAPSFIAGDLVFKYVDGGSVTLTAAGVLPSGSMPVSTSIVDSWGHVSWLTTAQNGDQTYVVNNSDGSTDTLTASVGGGWGSLHANVDGSTFSRVYDTSGRLLSDKAVAVNGTIVDTTYAVNGDATTASDDGHGTTYTSALLSDGSGFYHYRGADGSHGDWVLTADGNSTSSYAYADGSCGDAWTHADGSSFSHWVSGAGGHGTSISQADGSYTGSSVADDGGTSSWYGDSLGHGYRTSTDALGNWQESESFADGSYHGSSRLIDGRTSDTVADGHGNSVLRAVNATGDVKTQNFSADGSLKETLAGHDGSFSETDTTATGNVSGFYHNADGTHGTFETDNGILHHQDYLLDGTIKDSYSDGFFASVTPGQPDHISVADGNVTVIQPGTTAVVSEHAAPSTLVYGDLFSTTNLKAIRNGQDLLIVDAQNGAIDLRGWYAGQAPNIQTPDGQVWTPATINDKFNGIGDGLHVSNSVTATHAIVTELISDTDYPDVAQYFRDLGVSNVENNIAPLLHGGQFIGMSEDHTPMYEYGGWGGGGFANSANNWQSSDNWFRADVVGWLSKDGSPNWALIDYSEGHGMGPGFESINPNYSVTKHLVNLPFHMQSAPTNDFQLFKGSLS